MVAYENLTKLSLLCCLTYMPQVPTPICIHEILKLKTTNVQSYKSAVKIKLLYSFSYTILQEILYVALLKYGFALCDCFQLNLSKHFSFYAFLSILQDNIGVFVDQNGKLLQDGNICWSKAPVSIVIHKPYALARLPRHVEVNPSLFW